MTTKPALKSKTIKGALISALVAVGTAVASTYTANQEHIILFIQSVLPSYLDGLAMWAIPAIGAALTGLFTAKTVEGRLEAEEKIKGIF